MKTRFLILFIVIFSFSFINFAFSKDIPVKFDLSDNASSITSNTIVVSGSYQPYHIITIKSEVSGKILKMNIDEGEVVPRGVVYWHIDSSSLQEQAKQIEDTIDLLKKQHKILLDILNLKKKTLNRYQVLYKRHRIPEQTLDNIRLEYLSNLNTIIANEQQQHQLFQKLISLKDTIRKCNPYFDQTYYVSELYHFTNEYVTVGEPIAKLLDISRARVRLILAPNSFLSLKNWIKNKAHLHCFIKLDQTKEWRQVKDFHFERIKVDPASGYLYSYSVDLILKPISSWLWGQVVKVRLVYNP